MAESVIDQGRVIDLVGDQARVEIATREACAACGARFLCSPGTKNSNTLTAFNEIGAKMGDQVEVRERGNLLLKLSLLQYGLPLLGFVLGLFVIYLIIGQDNELILFLTGCLGLGFGALLAWLGIRFLARQPQHFLVVTRIIN
ncbi:MAG: SoxR reducing system RseC family protein [Candidatus Marinimicrobia bacterium]|nr:SoxR reducing system RseC family protein [Candidatus Neomarinimicrobiota bacterium]